MPFSQSQSESSTLSLDTTLSVIVMPGVAEIPNTPLYGQFCLNGDWIFSNISDSLFNNWSLAINQLTDEVRIIQNNIAGSSRVKAAAVLNGDIFVCKYVPGIPQTMEIYISDDETGTTFSLVQTVNLPGGAGNITTMGSATTNGIDTIVFNLGSYSLTSVNSGVTWTVQLYADNPGTLTSGIEGNGNNCIYHDGFFYACTGFYDNGGADFQSRIQRSADGLVWSSWWTSLGGLNPPPPGDMLIAVAIVPYDDQFAVVAYNNTGAAFAPDSISPALISLDGLTTAVQTNLFYSAQNQQTPSLALTACIGIFNDILYIFGENFCMFSVNGINYKNLVPGNRGAQNPGVFTSATPPFEFIAGNNNLFFSSGSILFVSL